VSDDEELEVEERGLEGELLTDDGGGDDPTQTRWTADEGCRGQLARNGGDVESGCEFALGGDGSCSKSRHKMKGAGPEVGKDFSGSGRGGNAGADDTVANDVSNTGSEGDDGADK
jgi:hypothetical protein